MGQITKGIRGILSHPTLYCAFQNLMGARNIRRRFVEDFVRPFAGATILDIGCGPADILCELSEVDYWGIDPSKAYIQRAKRQYPHRGHFSCQTLTKTSLEKMPRFDIVMGLGVLHHLDDTYAAQLLALIRQALTTGGRFVSFDPCLVPGQNPIARFLIQHDRGLNVRREPQYRELVAPFFLRTRGEVRHQALLPYTHFMMECHTS